MKNKIIVCTVAVTLFFLFSSLSTPNAFLTQSLQSSNTGTAKVIKVPDDYRKVQDAIDAANAGDTVSVAAGTYYESLFINKSLTLTGADSKTTIIDGSLIYTVIEVNASNVVITGFTIRNGGDGVYLYFSSNSRVCDNRIINCLVGVGLEHASNNTITNNIFLGNQFSIDIYEDSTSNTISDNLITQSEFDGIALYLSGSNTISNNTISGDNTGMSLSNSDANTIVGNTILRHGYAGIEMYESGTNIFYHNNFINNSVQVLPSSKNNWNNTSGGNYWSDYAGADTNSDGIGDTPHTINTLNIDYFPLMNPYDKTKPRADAGPDRLVVNGTKVTFNGNASTDNIGIKDYTWTFTDVNPQILQGVEANYTFNNLGNFTVTLNVSDYSGNWDIDSMWVNVTETLVFRDVAIISITASPITATSGDIISINVTVLNKGNFTETFTVAVSYDSSFIESKIATSLGSGTNATLTFNWDTTGVPGRDYTIEAVADPVPAEVNTADNTRQLDGKITINRAPSTLTIFIIPSNITLGDSTTINGSVSPAVRRVNVTINYRLTEGVWDTLPKVTTDAYGRYSYRWTPPTAGTYQIKASWNGDPVYLPQESNIETLIVKEKPNFYLYAVVIAAIIIIAAATGVYVLRVKKRGTGAQKVRK